MTRWQKISLAMAICTALFLSGIGISIAESSIAGILLCLFGSIMTPGIGFMLKKRLNTDE
jgi:hypothetical protein